MEKALIDFGLSYTWSKAIPYLVMLLLGIVLVGLLSRTLKQKNKWIKRTVMLVSFALPFSIYFALNPIYQGDFSLEDGKVNIQNEYTTQFEKGLFIVAKPGCPYCYGCIAELNALKKRQPQLKIFFSVVNGNDYDLRTYGEQFKVDATLDSIPHFSSFKGQIEPSFPTFLWVENGVAKRAWTNNFFGAREKDFILSKY